jgi:hypothetical protein
MTSVPREYDPEIKDIADYVANKEIDSELAVSSLSPPSGLARLLTPRLTQTSLAIFADPSCSSSL